MAMKKSVPARLAKKEVTQTFARLMNEARRWRKAVNMNCEPSGIAGSRVSDRAAYHDITGEEVCTAKDYHDKPNGEEHGRDGADKTWCVLLVPGCCFRGQQDRAAITVFSSSVLSRLIGTLGSDDDFASQMHAQSEGLTYPKPNKGPAMKEFQNNLSHLMCVFLHPILETSSMVCWGVKASMACAREGV